MLARDKVIKRTYGGALMEFNQRFPVWSKYPSDFSVRDLISNSKATGLVDDSHKSPYGFSGMSSGISGGRTKREAT